MEHQLKLHSESLQQRIEELERENAGPKVKSPPEIKQKKNELEKKDTEMLLLKSEIQNLKHILKSYEDQALKLSDLEKKLRNQNTKHEKEMKLMDEKYKEKLRHFAKKYSNPDEAIKFNSSFKTTRKDEDEIDNPRVNVFSKKLIHSIKIPLKLVQK